MARASRALLKWSLVMMGVGLALSLAAGAALYQSGWIVIRVHEKTKADPSIHLVVPVALVRAGLAVVPDREMAEAREAARRFGPILTAVVSELGRCEDGPLVEVTGADESVRIVKTGSTLVIDVDDRDAAVHLSIPLGAVSAVAERFARASSSV